VSNFYKLYLLLEKEEKQYEPPYYSIKDRLDHAKDRKNKRDNLPSNLLKKVERKIAGKILGNITVYFVDGETVRDFLDIDFTQAGHGNRYFYIDPNELWVEEYLRPPDCAATIIHEQTESIRMLNDNEDYSTAHDAANRAEGSFRKLTRQGKLVIKDYKQALIEAEKFLLDIPSLHLKKEK